MDIKQLTLGNSNILVLKVPGKVNKQQANKVSSQVRKKFKLAGLPRPELLILGDGISLSVMSK